MAANEMNKEMKSLPLDWTRKQSLATLIEGGFTKVVEAEITGQVKEKRKENDQMLEGISANGSPYG